MGVSNFTYAEGDWPIGSAQHMRALEVIGGVPDLVVTDNTKVAVITSCLFDR